MGYEFIVERDGQLTFIDPVIKERSKLDGAFAHCKSLSDDWYTPPEIIEAARAVMGSIDLDPATTEDVNTNIIKAGAIYTIETDGLNPENPWFGRMWINPPYGKGDGSAKMFMRRLKKEIDEGNVTQAITCLNFNSMTSAWAHKYVWPCMTVHCISRGRTNFYSPDPEKGSSPTSGAIFSYSGNNVDVFIESFSKFGVCVNVC
jgi:ParB family chromosome partitioning protein